MTNKTIHVGGRLNLVPNEIVMFEGDTNYTHIHTKSDGVYIVATTLKILEKRVNSSFYRSHKKFIVNLREIEAMSESKLSLSNQKEVLLARRRKSGLLEKLKKADYKRIRERKSNGL